MIRREDYRAERIGYHYKGDRVVTGEQLLADHNEMGLEVDGIVVEEWEVRFVHLGFEISGPNGLRRVSGEGVQQAGGVGVVTVCLGPIGSGGNGVYIGG